MNVNGVNVRGCEYKWCEWKWWECKWCEGKSVYIIGVNGSDGNIKVVWR